MAKKKKLQLPAKLQPWLEARQRYRLSDLQIQMARELGLNPRKFGGYANHRQEPWKRPLGECWDGNMMPTIPGKLTSIGQRRAFGASFHEPY
jgi:hypothetical protein